MPGMRCHVRQTRFTIRDRVWLTGVVKLNEITPMNHHLFVALLAGALNGSAVADEPIRHSFFIAGPMFTGIIDEDGQEVFNAGRPAARDGYVLSSGNVLVAWKDEVLEMTRNKEVVFRYGKSAENQEIGTVQRLENGRTLITELGKKPRLLEVAKDGTIEVEVPLQPETDNAHMKTRM